jgi:dual-specificity kinase
MYSRVNMSNVHDDYDSPIKGEGRYKILSPLGEGTFSRVIRCWDRQNSMEVAIKVMKKYEDNITHCISELSILETLKSFEDFPSTVIKIHKSFINYQDLPTMVLELHGEDLSAYMTRLNRPCNSSELRGIIQQCLKALAFIHSHHIGHMDIKLENILINEIGEVKITDFGCSLTFEEVNDILVCTPGYRPPEVIKGQPWDERVDIWSLGCVIHYLAVGQYFITPDDSSPQMKDLQEIENKLSDPEPFSSTIECPDLRSLLTLMLKYNFEERPKASDLLNHSYFAKI